MYDLKSKENHRKSLDFGKMNCYFKFRRHRMSHTTIGPWGDIWRVCSSCGAAKNIKPSYGPLK